MLKRNCREEVCGRVEGSDLPVGRSALPGGPTQGGRTEFGRGAILEKHGEIRYVIGNAAPHRFQKRFFAGPKPKEGGDSGRFRKLAPEAPFVARKHMPGQVDCFDRPEMFDVHPDGKRSQGEQGMILRVRDIKMDWIAGNIRFAASGDSKLNLWRRLDQCGTQEAAQRGSAGNESATMNGDAERVGAGALLVRKKMRGYPWLRIEVQKTESDAGWQGKFRKLKPFEVVGMRAASAGRQREAGEVLRQRFGHLVPAACFHECLGSR